MKSIIKFFMSFLLMSMIIGCRSIKYVPAPSTKDSIVVEKLVPVVNPTDSATIRALLKCDENGKVLLSWYDQEVSKNAMLKFQIDSLGRLLANFVVPHDTIYIPQKETNVKDKELVPYPVEKPLSRWEQFKMDVGGYAIFIISIIIIYIIGRLLFKIKR